MGGPESVRIGNVGLTDRMTNVSTCRYQHLLIDKEDALRSQLDLIDSTTMQQQLTQHKV